MSWLLRRQYKSRDPEVREQTLNRLSTKAGVKDVALFAEALLDENMDVRRAANRAIEMVPPSIAPQCIKALLPLLKHKNFTLRKGAALALQLIGWVPETFEESALCHIALANFETVPIEPGAIEPLLDALQVGALSTQVGAARALEEIQKKYQDPRIAKALLIALKNPEANLRAAAASALGTSNDEQRIDPLLKSLKDSVPLVRAAAAESIGRTGNAKYLKNLSSLLRDENFEVRVATVSAVTKIDSPEALDLIISALRDGDADVRKCAIESLGKLRNPRSIGALIEALVDSESAVRHTAANVLQVINCDWRWSKEAQEAVPRLEAALNDSEYWVREAAGKALNRIRNS
jgi:HEAT repeat protein